MINFFFILRQRVGNNDWLLKCFIFKAFWIRFRFPKIHHVIFLCHSYLLIKWLAWLLVITAVSTIIKKDTFIKKSLSSYYQHSLNTEIVTKRFFDIWKVSLAKINSFTESKLNEWMHETDNYLAYLDFLFVPFVPFVSSSGENILPLKWFKFSWRCELGEA